jgi:hypothetical protein
LFREPFTENGKSRFDVFLPMRSLPIALNAMVLLVLVGGPPVGAQDIGRPAVSTTSASPYDLATFTEELKRISAIVEKNREPQLASLRDALPAQWIVATPERQYSVSTAPLRHMLTTSPRKEAQAWIGHLREELSAYANPAPSSQQPRLQLDRILARQEFGAARPPNAWELFRRRVMEWLQRLLAKIFAGIARYPLGGKILFWLLVVGAVSAIAALVFRFLANRDRVTALPVTPQGAVGRTWQEWIHAAREAAKLGNYREAVHSAYWAGIARLEDLGAVPKDRTKTPREYLRLIADPPAGQLALNAAQRDPLAGLTQRLERVWYANRGARPEDFTDSLRQLEGLGCPLE